MEVTHVRICVIKKFKSADENVLLQVFGLIIFLCFPARSKVSKEISLESNFSNRLPSSRYLISLANILSPN